MKIIIVGCGKVGRNIAENLVAEGHDLVLVDTKASVVEEASTSLDVLGIIGNGIDSNTLLDAGIKKADILLAVTESDELNLLCCLIAKKLANVKTIARVRDPDYQESIQYIKDDLGLAMWINPEMAAAKEIASLLRFPNAIKIDSFARGRVDLLRFIVPKDSILANKKIKDIASVLKMRVLFAGIEREDEAIIPNGNSSIKAGDKVSIIVEPSNASEFFEKAGIISKRVKKVMIVGGSRIAYYLSKMLIDSKIKVSIIERDENKCSKLAELLPKATIICGDGSNEELLEEEGIGAAEGFVAITGTDEQNVLLSLYAKSRSNVKTVTKVNHINYNGLIGRLDLDSVICPKDITADNICQYVRALNNATQNEVETLYHIFDGKAEALSFKIKEQATVVGVPFEKLKLKDNLLICAILRNGKVITPTGKDMFKIGDVVIVVTTHLGLSDIKDIEK